MYYIYFSYVVILAILMAVFCVKQGKNIWWSAIVLFAPVTTPYFIAKFGKRTAGKWASLFIVTFLLVVGAEGFFWFQDYKEDRLSRLNPVDRTTLRITQAIQAGVSDLNEIMEAFDLKRTVASGEKEISTSRDTIQKAKILLKRNQKKTGQFVLFVTDYGPYFQQTRQEWVLQLRDFYKGVHMEKYYSTTQQYLDGVEQLLNYAQKNFAQIRSRQSQVIKNYDQYFIRYRHGANLYQQYSNERMKVQNILVKKYPEIKSYLPSGAQTTAVNLWD